MQPLVRLQVALVVLQGRLLSLPPGEPVEDSHAVLGVAALAALHVDVQAEVDDVVGEELLALGLHLVPAARGRRLHLLLVIRQAPCHQGGLVVPHGGDVEDGVRLVADLQGAVAGPDAVEGRHDDAVARLHVQGHQHVEVSFRHRAIEGGLLRVAVVQLLVPRVRVLPVGEGPHPEGGVGLELPRLRLELHVVEEPRDLLGEGADHKPLGGLLLVREHLHEGAALLLSFFGRALVSGRGLDQPVVELVQGHGVNLQLHLGDWVPPPVAVLGRPLDHAVQLLQGHRPVLGAVDGGRPDELGCDLLHVRAVVDALERKPREPLHLGLDAGDPVPVDLGPDGGHVGDEEDRGGPPLPLGLLQAQEDLLAVLHGLAVHHVDLPPDLDALSARLASYAGHDAVVPLDAVLARCVAKLHLGHVAQQEVLLQGHLRPGALPAPILHLEHGIGQPIVRHHLRRRLSAH
mmetsp:Transcript_50297/g.132988  ORF Transcript_50297/g.132988 Transcript_50297/m.132988 type:complete len:460 (+) Transcript_50297:832-2211(+)